MHLRRKEGTVICGSTHDEWVALREKHKLVGDIGLQNEIRALTQRILLITEFLHEEERR